MTLQSLSRSLGCYIIQQFKHLLSMYPSALVCSSMLMTMNDDGMQQVPSLLGCADLILYCPLFEFALFFLNAGQLGSRVSEPSLPCFISFSLCCCLPSTMLIHLSFWLSPSSSSRFCLISSFMGLGSLVPIAQPAGIRYVLWRCLLLSACSARLIHSLVWLDPCTSGSSYAWFGATFTFETIVRLGWQQVSLILGIELVWINLHLWVHARVRVTTISPVDTYIFFICLTSFRDYRS